MPGGEKSLPVYCYLALIDEHRRIHVAKRNPKAKNRPGQSDLFGGGQEKKKDITKKRTVKREVKEESGLKIKNPQKVYDKIVNTENGQRYIVGFVAFADSDTEIKLSDEHAQDGSGWVDAEQFETIEDIQPYLKEIGLLALSKTMKVKVAA